MTQNELHPEFEKCLNKAFLKLPKLSEILLEFHIKVKN